MEFPRGSAIVGFPFGLVNRLTGEAITSGTVNVYITIDGGTQFPAQNVPIHKGNGQWSINFNGNETNGTFIGISIVHIDAIPEFFTINTTEPDTNTPVIVVNISSAGTSIVGNFEYYGTLTAADLYFDNRLFSDCWINATIKDRQSALIAAARAIDKLNYIGCKNDTDQNLQFPRGDDITIPVEVEYAAYEIALKLLEGADSEIEAQALGVMSESYSDVKTAYQIGYVNEHLRAGIPSIEAWDYLKPFLRDSREVNLIRVN
jgi:hypothetical protein